MDGCRYRVFVPDAAPGDVVEVKVASIDGPLVHGNLQNVVSKGKDRVDAPCPYFGVCGGCTSQHVSYSRQLVEKRDLVSRSLSPVIPDIARKVKEVIPASTPYGTRTRGRFHVAVGPDFTVLGLHASRSDDVVDIESCMAVVPRINEALAWVRRFWLDELPDLSQVEFVVDELKGRVIAVAYPPIDNSSPGGKPRWDDILMPEEQPPKWLSIQVGERQEGAHFYPLKGDRPLRFAPEVFSQSDFVQNRVLVQEVLNACAVKKTDRVLDLCCGVGNFSLPLSQKAKVVEGVEGSRRAVELASKNALRWGARNVMFVKGDVSRALYGLARKGKRFDVVVLDPPRVGVGVSVESLDSICARRLVYVSCDPRSLAKDLAWIKTFKVKYAQPIDMFPQTMHVETVVVMDKDHSKDSKSVSGMPKRSVAKRPVLKETVKIEDL